MDVEHSRCGWPLPGATPEAIEHANPYTSGEMLSAGEAATYGDAYITLARAKAFLGNPDASREAYARAHFGISACQAHPVAGAIQCQ